MQFSQHDLQDIELARGVSRFDVIASSTEKVQSITATEASITVVFTSPEAMRIITLLPSPAGWTLVANSRVPMRRESDKPTMAVLDTLNPSGHGKFHFAEGDTPTSWGLKVEAYNRIWARSESLVAPTSAE